METIKIESDFLSFLYTGEYYDTPNMEYKYMLIDSDFVSKSGIIVEMCFVDQHWLKNATYNGISGVYAIKKILSSERSSRKINLYKPIKIKEEIYQKPIEIKEEIKVPTKLHNLNCEICKNDFHTIKKDQKYCSNKCRGVAMSIKGISKAHCGYCGKEIDVAKFLLNSKVKHGHKIYCKECVASGEYVKQTGKRLGKCTQCGCVCSKRDYKWYKGNPFCTNECKSVYVASVKKKVGVE